MYALYVEHLKINLKKDKAKYITNKLIKINIVIDGLEDLTVHKLFLFVCGDVKNELHALLTIQKSTFFLNECRNNFRTTPLG